MSASNQNDLTDGLSLILSAIATFVVVVFVVGFFTTGPIIAGIFGGLDSAVAWMLLLGAVAYVGYYTDDLSIAFGLSSVAVLLFISGFLPDWVTQPFAFISTTLLGRTFTQIDPVRFGVLVAATVVLYWIVKVRLTGRAKKPSTVVKRVRVNATRLVREYFTIGRLAFGFGAAVVFLAGSEAGAGLGEVWHFVEQAPVVSGYAATLAAGWGTFIGNVPVLGGLSAMQFGVIALAVFALVVGVKYTEEGDF